MEDFMKDWKPPTLDATHAKLMMEVQEEVRRMTMQRYRRAEVSAYLDMARYKIVISVTCEDKRFNTEINCESDVEAVTGAAHMLWHGWDRYFKEVCPLSIEELERKILQCEIVRRHIHGSMKPRYETQSYGTSSRQSDNADFMSETSSVPAPQSASPTTRSTSMAERFTSSLSGQEPSPTESSKTKSPA